MRNDTEIMEKALLDPGAAWSAVASTGKVDVIGYCWGGYIAWIAAARLPGFACAVPHYGGGMTDAIKKQPKCPVMAHFGERDSMRPAAGAKARTAAHPAAPVFLYAADHAFNCDQRLMRRRGGNAREHTPVFLCQHLA